MDYDNVEKEKMIAIFNFSEEMITSLKSFFAAHGYYTVISETLNDLIQTCREHVLFLICFNVFEYDTSWIHLITSMTLDPLMYEAPLLICCATVEM